MKNKKQIENYKKEDLSIFAICSFMVIAMVATVSVFSLLFLSLK